MTTRKTESETIAMGPETILDRGCKGFLQKPLQLEHLSRKVSEMLD